MSSQVCQVYAPTADGVCANAFSLAATEGGNNIFLITLGSLGFPWMGLHSINTLEPFYIFATGDSDWIFSLGWKNRKSDFYKLLYSIFHSALKNRNPYPLHQLKCLKQVYGHSLFTGTLLNILKYEKRSCSFLIKVETLWLSIRFLCQWNSWDTSAFILTAHIYKKRSFQFLSSVPFYLCSATSL